MKNSPILFSTPMIQSILDNRKTQTRRVVTKHRSGPCDTARKIDLDWSHGLMYPNNPFGIKLLSKVDSTVHRVYPPYEVGDQLWVKESYYAVGYWEEDGITKTGKTKYRFIDRTLSDGHQYIYQADKTLERPEKQFSRVVGWYKRNSIFMPCEASRITLEITDIRVERLQDISEEDAKAEGVEPIKNPVLEEPYKYSFGLLWVEINGQESWRKNPWVWKTSFKRIES